MANYLVCEMVALLGDGRAIYLELWRVLLLVEWKDILTAV
jgi:hypothetical protein